MSNYNAIATEADFNGPEHTSWRGVQPARVVANIRVSTDFDLSKANFRKLNYYFNSEVCITVKKKESLEKSGVFITLSKKKDHHCSMHCVLQCMLGNGETESEKTIFALIIYPFHRRRKLYALRSVS